MIRLKDIKFGQTIYIDGQERLYVSEEKNPGMKIKLNENQGLIYFSDKFGKFKVIGTANLQGATPYDEDVAHVFEEEKAHGHVGGNGSSGIASAKGKVPGK